MRKPYFRVVGIEMDTDGPGRVSGAPITPEEEEEFRQLASTPDVYDTVTKSIAPSIYGSTGVLAYGVMGEQGLWGAWASSIVMHLSMCVCPPQKR